EPTERDIPPSYEQKTLPELRGRLVAVATPEGGEHAVTIHADARVFATKLGEGDTVRAELAPGRRAWVQVAKGALTVNGVALREGDGAAIEGERALTLTGSGEDAEALVFDL